MNVVEHCLVVGIAVCMTFAQSSDQQSWGLSLALCKSEDAAVASIDRHKPAYIHIPYVDNRTFTLANRVQEYCSNNMIPVTIILSFEYEILGTLARLQNEWLCRYILSTTLPKIRGKGFEQKLNALKDLFPISSTVLCTVPYAEKDMLNSVCVTHLDGVYLPGVPELGAMVASVHAQRTAKKRSFLIVAEGSVTDRAQLHGAGADIIIHDDQDLVTAAARSKVFKGKAKL